MKLLLDQGLPRSTIAYLADFGIVAEHVGELGMSAASDDQILGEARLRQSVVVTLDAEFHQKLAVSRATSPSVIRIRIERLKGAQLAAILAQVASTTSAEIAAGAVVSVTPGRIRVRLLPIGQ
jgi:predicted nuclease of predicted toxin-antitoxin system